jgi:hypothetical protein
VTKTGLDAKYEYSLSMVMRALYVLALFVVLVHWNPLVRTCTTVDQIGKSTLVYVIQ